MRHLIFIVSFSIVMIVPGWCDKVGVPFSVYPKEVVKKFDRCGYKLDLDGNDRTKESWGFLDNEGTRFLIYTYKPVTIQELELIQRIVFSEGEEDGQDYCHSARNADKTKN